MDFGPIAQETGLKIVTPLDVYRQLAPRYHSLAVIAANAQGTAALSARCSPPTPELTLRSTGLLPVVLSIEAGEPPEELVSRHRLPELCGWYESVGAEALVLGCTHFPYFKETLGKADRFAHSGSGGGNDPPADGGISKPPPGTLKCREAVFFHAAGTDQCSRSFRREASASPSSSLALAVGLARRIRRVAS